jgi:hypothetical protein
MDGTGLRFETMEHGGEYPDTMPQAIKLVDAEGRSCIYVPITQDGKVVDSQGYILVYDISRWVASRTLTRAPITNLFARKRASGSHTVPSSSRTMEALSPPS